MSLSMCRFFFFNDTATTEIYTLSLHDALPIFPTSKGTKKFTPTCLYTVNFISPLSTPTFSNILYLGASSCASDSNLDRKSTRLNSSHANISYAVFCLKKKQESIKPYGAHANRL